MTIVTPINVQLAVAESSTGTMSFTTTSNLTDAGKTHRRNTCVPDERLVH
jgi:hypothetical protein